MSEEILPGETPSSDQQEGETPETGEEPFDKGRAMETIRKLRSELKDASKGARRLKELEDTDAQRAQKDLSEAEKAKGFATKAQQEAEMAKAALTEATIRYEFMLAALKPGSGVEPTAAEAAWKLVERESIEVDEQGRPKDVMKALRELVKQYPFLAAKTEKLAPNINAGETGLRRDGAADATRVEDLKRRFRLG